MLINNFDYRNLIYSISKKVKEQVFYATKRNDSAYLKFNFYIKNLNFSRMQYDLTQERCYLLKYYTILQLIKKLKEENKDLCDIKPVVFSSENYPCPSSPGEFSNDFATDFN